jgi:transcriptional regulator with XRE-family HTH domain
MTERDLIPESTARQLYEFLEIDPPEAVLKEAQTILRLISPSFDATLVNSAFDMIIRVFKGEHPEYQACNTYYHDLRHTTDAFLAMARLIHGAFIQGEGLGERTVDTALIAALFHDTGYLQKKHDRQGTGAKFSLSHVKRSMEFLKRHGPELNLSQAEVAEGSAMISCTDISREIRASRFPSPIVEILCRILNAADLVAQMADSGYLEKLLFLYHEYKEGKVGNYVSEVDLLRKTIGFYEYIEKRLEPISEKVNRFMVSHFDSRWGIPRNLYAEAIQDRKDHLRKILAVPGGDPRDRLYRSSIIEKVRAIYGPG